MIEAQNLQFLWGLHFIEASGRTTTRTASPDLQFFRGLHFIEVSTTVTRWTGTRPCSSFGGCTSLRHRSLPYRDAEGRVAVPSGTALH